MKIAIASGKGGTGKTMVATSMASTLSTLYSVQFFDCDVEAPNAHLFLKPEITQTKSAIIWIPKIENDICNSCGKCVRVCEFHAIAMVQGKILVFPQLCHGCGSCSVQCPEKAISEVPRKIGIISHGIAKSTISYYMGELLVSEPMPTPVIRQLKSFTKKPSSITILDSPPGASCAVVATIHDADFVLLVTEPTPFGLHDLKKIIGILAQTGSPAGVIINRVGISDNRVEAFLSETPYPVLLKIPYQREIAIGLAGGSLLTDLIPTYHAEFHNLYEQILDITENEGES